MNRQVLNYSEGHKLRHHPEIEKHLDIIIEVMGKEYGDKVNHLQSLIAERDFHIQNLTTEIKELRSTNQEKNIEARHFSESCSNLKLRVDQLEKFKENSENKIKELTSKNSYLENELRNKEEQNIRLTGDVIKLSEENKYFNDRNVVQERKTLELEDQSANAIAKTLKAESFLLTKDEIIKGLNKKIMEEKERVKKLEDTVIEIEEFTYKLNGDVDRITKERDFLKDEIDRFRKKYGF